MSNEIVSHVYTTQMQQKQVNLTSWKSVEKIKIYIYRDMSGAPIGPDYW